MLDQSLSALAKQLQDKKITSVELVKDAYKNIEALQGETNAFITIRDMTEVIAEAKAADATSPKSPLHGIPYVLKDAYVTKGIKTTAASKMLSNYIPQYDATVYAKLKAAGAILIGKTNMDAWGHGASNENSDYGPVKNPWDTSRVAGGSSGGAAVAVAAQMASFAIAEDTGGSIRNPAAWNNVTGLKVTYGRVSRYGAIAYASSFDTVGPIGRSAEDCALILEATAGEDPYDATSSDVPVPEYSKLLNENLKGKVIGIPTNFFGDGLDPEIKEAIYQARKEYEKMGVKTIELTLPIAEYALSVYYLIGPSETSSNLSRYDGVRYGSGREGFTPESRRRVMIGTYALSAGYADAYYHQAQKVRQLLKQEFDKAFSQCDVLLTPVTVAMPNKIGELISDPLQNILVDIYTTPENPVGIPALALPCGFSQNKLPIGMQLVGKMFAEAELLAFGHQYQQVTKWHEEVPAILKGQHD
jgi:aspartyl-tRNA(Asn)/glutamyl-tRNA(Gln) amidotransferase subunit A